MDIFLSRSHTGATLMGSYKTQAYGGSSIRAHRRKLRVGEPTCADFSRTLSGVASSLFLVNPGAPSDRERLILASEAPDSFVYNYRDVVVTAEAPEWCPFNDTALHEHLMRRLERAGVVNRSKFVCNPVKAAGELCGFKYSGGSTPQNLIFPVGATEINWLVLLRDAHRLGTVSASAADAMDRMPDLREGGNSKNLAKQALRRMRIWRAINWVAEAARAAGMLRYEPFSVGCALYEHEVRSMQLKGRYERSMLYLGDHFCKESALLADIARGGVASDFWVVVDAVVKYKKRLAAAIENDRLDASSNTRAPQEDWEDTLMENTTLNDRGSTSRVEKTLEAAIRDYTKVGEARKAHLVEFVKTCMTPEQRTAVFNGVGGKAILPAYLTNLADAILANTAKSAVWVAMQSLLKQINFTVLHVVGYEAQRRLIFKLFMPALIALFIAQDGIGDSFLHGVFNLEVMKQRVAKSTIRDMLSRDTSSGSSKDSNSIPTAVSSTSIAAGPSRNYAQYDIASLYGQLSDCDSIPLSINVGIPLHSSVSEMVTVDHVVKHTINTGLAKIKTAEDNRIARRLLHRRKLQEKMAEESRRKRQCRRQGGEGIDAEDLEEEAEEVEEGEGTAASGESGDEEEEEEEDEEGEREPQQPGSSNRKRMKTNSGRAAACPAWPLSKAPLPLMGGKLSRRENVGAFALATIQNEDRQVNVESIQKLLTARHTKANKQGGYSANEMAEVSIKYIMNLIDNVFNMRKGSILNSIHCNRRTENGVYSPDTDGCSCDSDRHTQDCIDRVREQDAIKAESKHSVCPVDSANPRQVKARFQELIMDPPSLAGVEDAMDIERVLQNEQMLTSLVTNPVFNAILSADKGDLGRYVVITNIVKFMNAAILCLIDGDMPMLLESRAHIKKVLDKGKVKNTRKSNFASTLVPSSVAEATATESQSSSFQYLEAGHCPEPGIKDALLPECIRKLKSIAMEKGRGGRSAKNRQMCDHSFCRMLKCLFFSIDSTRSTDLFTDPASKATLFRLDDVCRDRKKYKNVFWYRDLINPVIAGSKDWVSLGEYTNVVPGSASPVDFYTIIKHIMVDEGVISVPAVKRGDEFRSTITNADQLLEECKAVSCEAFRPVLFNPDLLLDTERAPAEGEEESAAVVEEGEEATEGREESAAVVEEGGEAGNIEPEAVRATTDAEITEPQAQPQQQPLSTEKKQQPLDNQEHNDLHDLLASLIKATDIPLDYDYHHYGEEYGQQQQEEQLDPQQAADDAEAMLRNILSLQ